MHDTFGGRSENNISLNASCMTISGGRTEQQVVADFLPRHWLYE